MRRFVVVLLFASLISPAVAFSEDKKDENDPKTEYQLMTLGGKRIGFSASLKKDVQVDGKKLVFRESRVHMAFKRFGQTIKMKVTSRTWETPEGDFVKSVAITENPPAAPTKTTATRKGDKLALAIEVAGRVTESARDWKKGAKSAGWLERQLEGKKLKKGFSLKATTWSSELAKFVDTSITVTGRKKIKRYNGKEEELWAANLVQTGVPIKTTVFCKEDGEAILTRADILGQAMIAESVPAKIALKEVAGEELDIAVKTLIKVGKIKRAYKRDSVTYDITIKGDDPAKLLPKSKFQIVKKTGPNTARVKVLRVKLPGKADHAKKSPGKEFLVPNKYIQSDDELVKKLAAEGVADLKGKNPSSIALALEKYVRKKITSKNFSTSMASAAEVAKDCQGDCTEHSVLYAALLRVHEIPSRVAVGFVYVPSLGAFGGHMWTEAYIAGKWYPMDATMGAGGATAAHIKLLDSSFTDDGPVPTTVFLPITNALGNMKVKVVEEEEKKE